MRHSFITGLLFSTSLICCSSALAADDQEIENASIVTYDKAYFETLNPVTLLDMLQAVPGVPEILNRNRRQGGGNGGGAGQQERGFGAGGDQILMDGKRLAGKANNINDTLSRISAAQVEKIELIRGAASGLDVQSQGLVVNIIMMGGMSTSTTFWQLKGEYSGGHQFEPEGLISHSGSRGNFDYNLSYEYQNNDFFFDATEEFFNAEGIKTADQIINGDFDRYGHKIATNLSYDFEGGSRMRLNGLYEPNGRRGVETRSKTDNTLDPIVWLTDMKFRKWEIGGDYSTDLGFLGSLKALFVINRNTEDNVVNRNKGTGPEEFEYTRDVTDVERQEKIFRASLTKGITASQTLELGGEVAINTFNKTFDSFNRDVAIDPLVIGNSDNVEIKENRYEIFAIHSYNISSRLVLQSSLITEFSKIIAENIFENAPPDRRDTSFTYLKPRVNLRYDFTESDQLRILAEKKVSQLDFNNFVTRFDQQEQIFRFGNTQIRPEQTWDFAVTYEHRLPNDTGSLEGEVFYRTYKDHITTVDFTRYVDFDLNPLAGSSEFFALPPDITLRDYVDDTGDSYSAKSGNIDSAKAYGFKLRSNLRLGFIGVPDATLSVGYTYERRRAIDQFTLVERNFDRHSDNRIDFNFRHDIKSYKATYGFSGDIRSDNARHFLTYYWPNRPGMNLRLFAEKIVYKDIKVRLEAEGVTRNRGGSSFYLYNDHIRFGDLKERQDKLFRRPVELRISVQGTF